MTLEEYKRQSKEIYEAARNFSGTTQEEAIEFFGKIAQKYPEVTQFNEEAINCKNIDEFKKLADKFGLAFSSDKSAKKLFSILADSKKQLEEVVKNHENGAELSDDELDAVTGGVDHLGKRILLVGGGAALAALGVVGGIVSAPFSAGNSLAVGGIAVAMGVGSIVAGVS